MSKRRVAERGLASNGLSAVLSAACAWSGVASSALARQASTTPTPEAAPAGAEPQLGTPAQAAPSATASTEASLSVTDQPPTDPLPPTSATEELSQIRPGLALKREFDRIAAESNLRLGFANTILFQQATGGQNGRYGAGGDIDLLAKWTAIGAGTKDTGILAFAGEYRYQIGDRPPSELGGEIGTLIPTTNSFGERPVVVKELYWDQRLFDDHFRFAIGRIDPENLFGGHRLQSANTFFLYKAFSSNVSVTYPGPGLAAAAQVKPTSWLYCTVGLTDANGSATTNDMEDFFQDHEYLTFAEAGLTPTFDGLGSGRYRLAVWHIDEREDAGKPSDSGVTISLDQDFGEKIVVFVRYGHSDADSTGIPNSLQGGVGIKGVLGVENMLGVAVAWSEAEAESKRDETAIELFQRFQVNETIQFTLGVETIFDPGNSPDDDVLGVFSARLRVSF